MTQHNEKTIYIVDDDKAVLDSLKLLLRINGLTSRGFQSAAEFLDYHRPSLRGCLLLDIHMPDVDGLALQSALNEKKSTLPVIFITGTDDIPKVVNAVKNGAFDLLEKPYSEQQLLELIDRALTHEEAHWQRQSESRALSSRLESLTKRETEVLHALLNGEKNKIIADKLNISQRTVEIYRANVMQKMGTKSVIKLVRMVTEAPLESEEPS